MVCSEQGQRQPTIPEPLDCRRFCSCESLKEPQSSTAFNEECATGSISITSRQQISAKFNRVLNVVRDQEVEVIRGVPGSRRCCACGGARFLSPRPFIFSNLHAFRSPENF